MKRPPRPVCPKCGLEVFASKKHGYWVVYPKAWCRHTKGMCP